MVQNNNVPIDADYTNVTNNTNGAVIKDVALNIPTNTSDAHNANNTGDTNITDTTNDIHAKPYMGDLTSGQIGEMARAGKLGGEMVKRFASQEEELINKYEQNPMKS